MNKLGTWLSWLLTPVRGSNRVSLWARKHLEKQGVKQILGVQLASLTFAFAILVPQTNATWSTWEATREVPYVTIADTGPTDYDTRWPLANFGVSQEFWGGHPAMDLTAPFGSPVYPIAAGTVLSTQSISWGYGNHVLIQHNNNLQSLYAHFSKITVTTGQKVTKTTKIGEVGATGWATGNHVHLEVYQNGVAINPIEILPEIK